MASALKLRWSLLLLAAIPLSCRTMAPFPGPVDPPPQPTASGAPADAEVPPPLAPMSDAGTTLIPSATPIAHGELLSCEDQHEAFVKFLYHPKRPTGLIRDCYKQLPEDTPRITGMITGFVNPDGTLLTVRSIASPASPQFVSCVELRARKWLHLHPGCAGGKQRVRFAVDAKSVGR